MFSEQKKFVQPIPVWLGFIYNRVIIFH